MSERCVKLCKILENVVGFLDLKDIVAFINSGKLIRERFVKVLLPNLLIGGTQAGQKTPSFFNYGLGINNLPTSDLISVLYQIAAPKPTVLLTSSHLQMWDWSSFDFDQHPNAVLPDSSQSTPFWSTNGWQNSADCCEWLTFAAKSDKLIIPKTLGVSFYPSNQNFEMVDEVSRFYCCKRVRIEYYHLPPRSPQYGVSTLEITDPSAVASPFYQEEHELKITPEGLAQIVLRNRQPAKFMRVFFLDFPTRQPGDLRYYMAVRRMDVRASLTSCPPVSPLSSCIEAYLNQSERGQLEKEVFETSMGIQQRHRQYRADLQQMRAEFLSSTEGWDKLVSRHSTLLDDAGLQLYLALPEERRSVPTIDRRFGALPVLQVYAALETDLERAFNDIMGEISKPSSNKGLWLLAAHEKVAAVCAILDTAVAAKFDALFQLGVEYMTITPELIPKSTRDRLPQNLQDALRTYTHKHSYPLMCRRSYFRIYFTYAFNVLINSHYQSM